MSDLQLNRLRYNRQSWVGQREPANSFESLVGPREVPRQIRVCLHTRGLERVDQDELLILHELVADYRAKAIEAFRTPGETTHRWANSPSFEAELPEADTGESLRIRWMGTVIDSWLPYRRQLIDIGERRPGGAHGIQDLVELLAADRIGSDLIVTTKREVLSMRDEWPLSGLNVLSPREAFPVLGVWSRAVNECYLAGPMRLVGFYSWILTRALVPAAWPGFGAFVYGEHRFQGGEELRVLANSVLSRLDRLVEALDRMMVIWQTREQRGMARDFDGVVLGASAILDNLALLVGKFLGVNLKQHFEWSMLSKRWLDAVRRTGERGDRLVHYLRGVKPYLEVSREFRHHAVHRNLLETIGIASAMNPRESGERIELSSGTLRSVKEALVTAGEVGSAWGITGERGPERIPVTTHLGDDLVERHDRVSEGSALLDPMPFAVRLVAHVSRITNRVFEILDPPSDPRIPEDIQTRLRRRPGGDGGWNMFSAENSRVALLSSPLSGVVDWI